MTAERLGQLRDQQKQAWDMVHASRYRELAPLVASLIPELEQAVRASAAPELTEAVRELLTDTYQAVAAMMPSSARPTPRGSPLTAPRSLPRCCTTGSRWPPACSGWRMYS